MNSEEVSVLESTQNLKVLMSPFIDPKIHLDLSNLSQCCENDRSLKGTKTRILSVCNDLLVFCFTNSVVFGLCTFGICYEFES